MTPEEVQMTKDALSRAYVQGAKDGYIRAQWESGQFLRAMCKREPDGIIEILDSELVGTDKYGKIETGRLPGREGGHFYRVKQ